MKKMMMIVLGVLLTGGVASAKKIADGPFSRSDKDGDRKLNKEEYIAAKTIQSKAYWKKKGADFDEKVPDPEKKFGELFKKADADGDGFVSLEEWKTVGK